jgi:hypothetical protein
MVGWKSRSVRIAIRGLTRVERDRFAEPHPGERHCTLSLADREGDNTWICILTVTGGYDCPLVTSDGMPPLRNANGKTDRRGILRGVPLAGTHATPPLEWQRRYPHVDGFILPWTRSGKLRPGLSFISTGGARHLRGACSPGAEHIVPRASLRCFSDVQFDPCFAPTRHWNHRGAVVACGAPGWTHFSRFVISAQS